jgi:hypothetical protein
LVGITERLGCFQILNAEREMVKTLAVLLQVSAHATFTGLMGSHQFNLLASQQERDPTESFIVGIACVLQQFSTQLITEQFLGGPYIEYTDGYVIQPFKHYTISSLQLMGSCYSTKIGLSM